MTRPPEVAASHLTRVFLDPDGTGDVLFAVIVQRPTGVAYGTQCCGLRNEERYIEGYLVPVSGLMVEPDDGRINVEALRSVFHVGDTCLHGRDEFDAGDYVGALRNAVSKIPFWHIDAAGETHRTRLEINDTRLAEAVEGWVPVLTAVGPGILVWPNCD